MTEQKSSNVVWQQGPGTRTQRADVFNQQGATIWLTGLSGAGKQSGLAAHDFFEFRGFHDFTFCLRTLSSLEERLAF